jgi:hypothetical protein
VSDSEPLAAAEVLLFARVLDEATRAGIRDAELLPVLDLICAIARSDAGTLEIGGNGRPAVRCHVGDDDPDGVVFDLRGDGGHLGRLILTAPSQEWTAIERELLRVLAQVMAERFERSLAAESTRLAVVQLSAALESRVVLEQAKGMLAERHRTDVDVAFDRLRQSAREQRRTLREVAEEVVTHRAGLGRSR